MINNAIQRATAKGLDRRRRMLICFTEITIRVAWVYCETPESFYSAIETALEEEWFRARDGRWAFTKDVLRRVAKDTGHTHQYIRDQIAHLVCLKRIASTPNLEMLWVLS